MKNKEVDIIRDNYRDENGYSYINPTIFNHYSDWLERKLIESQSKVNGQNKSTKPALNMQNVSQRSELLLAYHKWICNCTEYDVLPDSRINEFISQL